MGRARIEERWIVIGGEIYGLEPPSVKSPGWVIDGTHEMYLLYACLFIRPIIISA